MGKLAKLRKALDNYKTRIVYHGSPHDFDAFDLKKIGTGEGAQAYGHGLYFTESDDLAHFYRRKLSEGNPNAALVFKHLGAEIKPRSMKWQEQDPLEFAAWALDGVPAGMSADEKAARVIKESRRMYPDAPLEFEDLVEDAARGAMTNAVDSQHGRIYRAEIPTTDYMLDWDKPLSEQPEGVMDALRQIGFDADAAKAQLAAKEAKLGELWSEWDESIRKYGANDDRSNALKAQIDNETRALADAKKDENMTGEMLHQRLFHQVRKEIGGNQGAETYQRAVAERLKGLGIVGINYVGDSSGVRNAVVFDDELVRVLEKGAIDPRLLAPVAAVGAGAGYAMQQYAPPPLPPLDPAYAEFARRREAKRDTWRQLKESAMTMGSAMAGGIVGDLSRLGGYLNPMMPVERTEQGAQGIETALMVAPTGPNRYLEGLGRGIEQAQQDFAPLTDAIPQSIPGRAYNALPERAQGLIRIGADLAL